MKQSRLILSAALGVALLVTSVTSIAFAADSKSSDKKETTATTQNATGSGVQGYAADAPMQTGTIVRLVSDKTNKANKVAPANQANLGSMYGVVVDPARLSVTINSGLPNEVQVATAGTFDVLVNTQGGAIKTGDYVTLSALDGVAMKADTEQKTVFGRAAGSFDGKTNGIGEVTLKDTKGKETQKVVIGVIPVAIDVRSNPNDKSTKANVPKFLQRIGEAIAEKPVGPLRIYLSIGITAISIMTALIILYSGVRSSLFSIGRNPLSKKSIFRGLLEIILTSIIILIIGLFAVYLLLKL